jgi:dihydroflavonol-4-reductase
MRRVLVTGGTGFVGSHLVEALCRRGLEVTVLVLPHLPADNLERLGVRVVRGSLDDHDVLAAAVVGHDTIFHVAGLVAARNEAEFLRVNRDGTKNLVLAAERAGTHPRFVLVSSMTAAGSARPGERLDGRETPQPVSRYSRSKLAGEEMVRRSMLPWTIVRPPMVYGPRDRDVLKVFKMVRLGVAPVFGSGAQELSAVFAPDLAEAMIAAASSARTIRRIYYPCHNEVFTSVALIHTVAAVIGAARVGIVPVPKWLTRFVLSIVGTLANLLGRPVIQSGDKTHEYFQPAWVGDPSPLERDTGWRARHDLSTGLSHTLSWYRGQRWF